MIKIFLHGHQYPCILGIQYILQLCCQGFDNNNGLTYKIAEALGNKSVVINFINFLPRSRLRKISLMIVNPYYLYYKYVQIEYCIHCMIFCVDRQASPRRIIISISVMICVFIATVVLAMVDSSDCKNINCLAYQQWQCYFDFNRCNWESMFRFLLANLSLYLMKIHWYPFIYL